ncbi:MAG: hypothetical protein V1907_03160 [Candidatus Kerfeldbacteria bacterium]
MNTKGIAIIPVIVIIAAVLALGVTGYFFYSSFKNTNESTDTNAGLINVNTNSTVVINGNVNENANTNSTIAVDGATKQTYTSNTYNLTFTYPSTWEKQDLPQSGLRSNEQVGLTPKDVLDAYRTENGNDSFWLTTFQIFSSSKTPKDWFNENISPSSRTDVNETPINGYPSYSAKIVTDSYTDREFIISHSGVIVRYHMREISIHYAVNGTVDDRQDYARYVSDFTSVVNSLRFTDQTAGWKTYSDSENVYNFKYPSKWNAQGTGSDLTLGVPITPNPNTGSTSTVANNMSVRVVPCLGTETLTQAYERVSQIQLSSIPDVRDARTTKTIGGITADVYRHVPGEVNSNDFIFFHNDKVYYIQMFDVTDSEESALLSTFTFTK